MNQSNIALKVFEVEFGFGTKFNLKNIGFSINLGQFKVLLGPNGAGKTTLFSLITRLYSTRHGKIEVTEFDLEKTPRQALAQMGVVFQQPTLDLDLSVQQNLLYHSSLHGLKKNYAIQRIETELTRFDMFDRRNEKIRQLNGGHRRRVEIARALLHKPKLLLLDEPTVGLDVPTRRQIVEHVHSLVRENHMAVLWATHLIDEVFHDDHVIILNCGEICADGPVSEVILNSGEETIAAAFDKLTGRILK